MRRACIVLAASLATAGGAVAQEVYVDEVDEPAEESYVEESYVESPAYEVEDVAPAEDGIVVERRETRVYGWSAERPDNCGTFKYWTGGYCADARYAPPED